jgi:hypothetical protein
MSYKDPCPHCADGYYDDEPEHGCVDCSAMWKLIHDNYTEKYGDYNFWLRAPQGFCGKSWSCFGVKCPGCHNYVCKYHMSTGKHACRANRPTHETADEYYG